MTPGHVSSFHHTLHFADGTFIRNRLLRRCPPPVSLPADQPLGEDANDIRAVGLHQHRNLFGQRIQSLKSRAQLHQVVCRPRMSPGCPAVRRDHPGPATRAWVAETRSVCSYYKPVAVGRPRLSGTLGTVRACQGRSTIPACSFPSRVEPAHRRRDPRKGCSTPHRRSMASSSVRASGSCP